VRSPVRTKAKTACGWTFASGVLCAPTSQAEEATSKTAQENMMDNAVRRFAALEMDENKLVEEDQQQG